MVVFCCSWEEPSPTLALLSLSPSPGFWGPPVLLPSISPVMSPCSQSNPFFKPPQLPDGSPQHSDSLFFPILLSFLVFPIPLCPLLTFSPIFYSPFLLSLFISLFFFPLLPSPFPFSHPTLFPSLLLPHTSSTLLSSPSLCPLSSLPTCTHLPLQIFSLSIRSHLIPCLSSFRHPHSFLSPNPLNFQ